MHLCNASFVVIFPFKIWSHALNIGASTLSSSHNFAAAGAVATPSATPAKDAARDSKTSATDLSSDATAKPTALFRLSAPRHVSIKSPTPANPPSVVALAPIAIPILVISLQPLVTNNATAFTPNPIPSKPPAKIATTFFNAPPTHTPTTSVDG